MTSIARLYWLSTLDRRVLEAITFSAAGHPATLSGLQHATEWTDVAHGESLAR